MDGNDSDWQIFLDKFNHRTYKRGQIILFQGESPRYAYIVKSGVVKTYNIDHDGKEQFVNLEVTGSVFPKLWIWGKQLNSQYYYEALDDCDIYIVSREAYVEHIKSDPKYLQQELAAALSDSDNSSIRLNALLYTMASDKIAHILKYLTRTYAPNNKEDIVDINLKLTHQHLASLTGLTRETVSVELNKFKSQGILSYKPSHYRINMPKLERVLKKEF
jgi:CRP-like cAMP-binding protein